MKAPSFFSVFPATLLLFAAPLGAQSFTLQKEKVKLRMENVTEASGIAVSPADGDFLWLVNDSGAGPEIHLADMNGADRGRIKLKDTKNVDWEDLSSFKLDGVSYLLVADTGDNDAKRETRVLYIVKEPKLPAAGQKLDLKTLPSWKIEFRYPGGPRDCESVAVDAAAGKILLLSKRTKPPELYELPLRPDVKRGVITAKALGTTEVKAPPIVILPYHDQPCGLTLSSDGRLAAVVTYYGAFLFRRGEKESWADAFARKGEDLGAHHLPQAESITFSRDGKTLFVTTEGKEPALVRYAVAAEGKTGE